MRVSLALCANAAGRKCKIIAIIPRKTPIPNLIVPSNIHLVYSSDSTFNKEIIETQFLNNVFYQEIKNNHIINPTLILDQATCHKTASVLGSLEKNKVNVVFIPSGMTNLVQPADVCWIAPFKRSIRNKWDDWLINVDRTFTVHGNPKAPSYAIVLGWISEAWAELDEVMIKNSFRCTGITSKIEKEYHSQLRTILKMNEPIFSYIEYNESTD